MPASLVTSAAMGRMGRQAGSSDASTVVVQRTLRGRWEVVLPGRRKGIICETLEDARRVAYLSVAHARRCEVIVRDAYHRVLDRESINGRQTPPPSSPPTAHHQDATTKAVVGRGGPPVRDTPASVSPGPRHAAASGYRAPSAQPTQPTHQGGQ